jgi:hypothetical protein
LTAKGGCVNSLYWDFCFASVVIFGGFAVLGYFFSLVLVCIFDYYFGVIWFIKIIEISLFMADGDCTFCRMLSISICFISFCLLLGMLALAENCGGGVGISLH